MAVQTFHFRVDNGDMTLTRLETGRTILTDINIRGSADNPMDPAPNVASQLRKLLKRDSQGRLYVDAFLLTHPDENHIRSCPDRAACGNRGRRIHGPGTVRA
jgi:hypothetical protein